MAITDLLFGKKDWQLVWEDKAVWDCESLIAWHEFERVAYYKIYFSSSRNKYKLKTSGLNPHGNSMMEEAKQQLSKFNSL